MVDVRPKMTEQKSSPDLQALVREFALEKTDVSASKLAQKSAMRGFDALNSNAVSGTHSALRLTEYASPLPPPDVLAQYEAQSPGLTKELVGEWRAERGHRRALDNHKVNIEYIKLWGSLALALIGLVSICALCWWGHPIPALGLGPFEAIAGWSVLKRVPSKTQAGEK